MHIVTTHTNTDFDALASTVAGTFLYPGAVGVMPGHMQPNVRDFFTLHQDLFRIIPRKFFTPEGVETLTVVDTGNWKRLDRMDALKNAGKLTINLWDHHIEGGDIEADWKRVEESGSTVTMMVEEIKKQDIAFSPIHATLFMLGIYSDTGCLSFPSTTPRDVYMAGFLLENGADLNMVSSCLNTTVDESHSDVFKQMLDTSEVVKSAGFTIGITMLPVKSGLTMLAPLVTRFKEFKGYDAAFGIFSAAGDKCMVIGRGSPQGIDVGAVARRLGGGGHPGAGSATVRSVEMNTLFHQVVEIIRQVEDEVVPVKNIMSDPAPFIVDITASMEDAYRAFDNSQVSAIIVVEKGKPCGALGWFDLLNAKNRNLLKNPVKGFMRREIPVLDPEQPARETLAAMNASDTGLLPVMKGDSLAGVVTRGDILLHLYNF